MTNAQLFIEEFNKLEAYFRKRENADNWVGFAELLARQSKSSAVVNNYKKELRDLGDLRNAIVHQSRNYDDPIAEPHSETITHLQEIYTHITKPQTARDIASTAVYTATANDDLGDVLKKMGQEGFTQTPILNEGGTVESVLSEHALLVCMAHVYDKGDFILEAAKVGDIARYLDAPTGQDTNTIYLFISSNRPALEVKDLYSKSMDGDKRLMCVFVTKNGKVTEKLEGMITPWDLSRITS